MELIPEVRRVIEQMGRLGLDGLDVAWSRFSDAAVWLVPSCVGLTMTVVIDDEPFTIAATSAELGVIDAGQYVDGGPCVESAVSQQPVSVPDVLDEQQWLCYRTAAIAMNVRSSLSMPLFGKNGRLPGAVNLYASEVDAFAGREEELASIFRVPAEELVTNADLSFMTLEYARRLPEQLDQKDRVDRAVAMLVERRGWSPDEARERLRSAAARVRQPPGLVADALLDLGPG